MTDSKQRVALITGSGKRRIGAHVADALAERGYSLALHYHTSAQDAHEAVARYEQRGVPAIALQANLCDDADARQLVTNTVAEFGRVDVLVNCAAIWERKRLEETTARDVRAHFEINVLGTFLCCQQAGLLMIEQAEGGVIVNLGDWAEIRPYPDFSAYFASKGAIPTLTRMLAVELGTRNPRVRVNCILPGPVMLPPDLPEKERRQSIAGTLVRHEGSPENIAQAVLYSIDNDFVTGTCLTVDGGRSIFAREG
jgi:pteridine reductase